jgi:hypothetical protein
MLTNKAAVLSVVLLGSLICKAQGSTAIHGNWLLTGSLEPAYKGPRLSLSLGVDGDSVLGMGRFEFTCPSGVGIGLTPVVEGRVAADGTFLLTDFSSAPRRTMTISGMVPQPGSPGQWRGNYSFYWETKRGNCSTGGRFRRYETSSFNRSFLGPREAVRVRRTIPVPRTDDVCAEEG